MAIAIGANGTQPLAPMALIAPLTKLYDPFTEMNQYIIAKTDQQIRQIMNTVKLKFDYVHDSNPTYLSFSLSYKMINIMTFIVLFVPNTRISITLLTINLFCTYFKFDMGMNSNYKSFFPYFQGFESNNLLFSRTLLQCLLQNLIGHLYHKI